MAARSRRRAVRGPLVALASLALLTGASLAHAEEPAADDRQQREELAKAAVRRGLADFARGDAQGALDEYRRAEVLVPDANVPYRYAAEALVALGRVDEAIVSLETYLAMKPDVTDGPTVRARLATLRASRQSTIVLECDAPVVAVRLDRQPAVSQSCPVEVTVPAGEHVLVLSADGREDTTTRITTTAGSTVRAGVRLAARGTTGASSSRAASAGKSGPGPWRTVGFVALGVGAGLLATGLVLDLAALGPKLDEARELAARGDPASLDAQSSARTLRAVTLGGYLAGAAIAATGAILVLVTPRAEVRAGAGPHGDLAATATFRFTSF